MTSEKTFVERLLPHGDLLAPTPGSMYPHILSTIEYTRNYATEMRETLEEVLEEISDVPNYVTGNIPTDFQGSDIPNMLWPSRPELQTVPEIPVPQFPNSVSVDNHDTPILKDFPVAPALSYPEGDIIFNPPVYTPVNIPEITTPRYSEAPSIDVTLSDYPTFDLADPIFRDIFLDFNYTEPESPNLGQVSEFNFNPEQYLSSLWDIFLPKIKEEVDNPGNGLSERMYQALLFREKEQRVNIEDRQRQEIYEQMASSGLDLPSGALTATLVELEKDILAKDMMALENIFIKDFEIADANAKFIKELSLKAEGMLRDFFNKSEDRRLVVAETASKISLAIFEQAVRVYMAQWDGIKIKFEAKKLEIDSIIQQNKANLDLYLGKIEAFAKQIDGLVAKDKIRLEQQKVKAEIYDTQIKAEVTKFQAEIEKIKSFVEQAKLALQEYGMNIDVEKSRTAIEQQKKQLELEIAKTKSQNYQTHVSAVSDENRSKLATTQMELEVDKLKVGLYSTQINAEEAKIKAYAARAQNILATNENLIKIFSEETNAVTEQLRGYIAQVQAELEKFRTVIAAKVDVEKINLDAFTSRNKLQTEVSMGIANIASQSIASALGAINTNMGYNYSGSESLSGTISISNSLSENHEYEEE